MSEINNYDPNPYDNVTIDEALAQIYDRVNDRTIRQIVTMLKNAIDGSSAGDISRYTVEKTTAESGEVTYKLMQQINNGTPTPVGDTVSLRGSQILANYGEELQILDNIINVIKVALDGKADTTDIPTVPITAIQKNGTGITPVDGTVNITVPIVAADVAALPDTTRYAAAISLTIDSATFVVTCQLKDQNGDNLGVAQTIDLPLESVVVGGSYNSQTKKVILTLQNGNTIEFSVADLVYGLQTELSETNKLNPAYINYDSAHAAVTEAQREQIEINKNNILSTCCVGTCTTAGNVAAKIVTIDDPNWVLRKGCIIGVKFTHSNGSSTNNVTLNVNNTGDKSIYYYSDVYTGALQSVCGKAGFYIYYMYDGTYWCWLNYGFDLTYSSMLQSEASAGTSTYGRLISAKVLSDTIDEKIQPLENNILLKADKISFGFSGNPNPAIYEKDWDFVPDGIYLLTYICSSDASTRKGVSVYMFSKYTTNHIVLFTPVVEASGATIASCVASGSAGAETITFTLAQQGYHTAAAIQIQAF